MLNFSSRSTDGSSRKDIPRIAQILRDSQFDILAIQEILDREALDSLLGALGPDRYKGSWAISPKFIGGKDVSREGSAFIWNNDRICLSQQFHHGKKVDVEPFFLTVLPPGGESPSTRICEQLERDPYIGIFKTRNAPYVELRLINTHILFGDSQSSGWVSLRDLEFRVLVERVYPWISDQVYLRNMSGVLFRGGLPFYTILLGDYNLNIGKPPFVRSLVVLDDGRRKRAIITVQDKDSTLKKPPRDPSSPDENLNNYWMNNYDHFSIDAERFDDVSLRANRMDSVKYCKDYIEHQKLISDHVPIFLDLDFRNES